MYKIINDDEVKDKVSGTLIPRGHRLWAEYEIWLADGNTPEPADVPPVVYSITPKTNAIRVGASTTIAVTGAPDVAVTLYAYPVTVAPTEEHELDPVTLDETGRGSALFTPSSIGEWAIRGASGELANVISTIKAVG